MLKIDINDNDIDQVMMPSDCLQIYRTAKRVRKEPQLSGLYWAIEIIGGKDRIAYLIKEEQRPAFQRPGIRSIIPAFKKES